MNDIATLPAPVGELDRRTYLGGSDAAAIMGLGAYGRTPYTTYLAKIGESPEEMDPDKRKFLERRKRWEGPIVEMLREEFGGEIVGINNRYIDPEHDFMAAEIDFEWRDTDGSIQNGEIKTVSPFAFGEKAGWGDAGTADIPIHYAAQVFHGLGVTGRRSCIVAAMVGLDNMIFYRLERDDETIAAMRAEMVRFWVGHVLKRVPPDPQSMRDLSLMMLKMRGRPVELEPEIATKLEQLRDVRERLKALEGAEESLAFELGNFVRQKWAIPADESGPPNENAVLTVDGQKVATWNRQRGASLDQKRLKVEHPEIIKEFTREYFFRMLRFSKTT